MTSRIGWVAACAAVLAGGSAQAGQFVLNREIPGISFSDPTYADYNGNGVEDFFSGSGSDTLRIIDGQTLSVLRSFQQPAQLDNSFGSVALTVRDVTGDGLRDLIIGDPAHPQQTPFDSGGAVYGIASSTPSGAVDMIPLMYQFDRPATSTTGGFGGTLAASNQSVLIGWPDAGRAMLFDPVTGAVKARLEHLLTTSNDGFGLSVGNAGDVNGDGVDDFAIGAPNVFHTGAPDMGEIYIIDGRVTSVGNGFVSISALSQYRLATLRTTTNTLLGATQGAPESIFAVLGDPNPNDNIRQQLFVASLPGLFSGGLAAFLMTQQPNGSISVTPVTQYLGAADLHVFGRSIVSVGDVNGDGMADLAVLQANGGPNQDGVIYIISGRGLLDGLNLSSSDVLQVIEDPQYSFDSRLRFLGDYNHDGLVDLVINAGGPRQEIQIYSAPVPEPASVAALLTAMPLILRRRRG